MVSVKLIRNFLSSLALVTNWDSVLPGVVVPFAAFSASAVLARRTVKFIRKFVRKETKKIPMTAFGLHSAG